MRDDDFEWDDDKAAANLARHGVSFAAARDVFDDPNTLHRDDDRMNYGEDRFQTIGKVGERLLSVSWTARGERIRIISARLTTTRERRDYHEQ